MDTRVRDVWVIHHRQRLPLLLEAPDDLARIRAQLDESWIRSVLAAHG